MQTFENEGMILHHGYLSQHISFFCWIYFQLRYSIRVVFDQQKYMLGKVNHHVSGVVHRWSWPFMLTIPRGSVNRSDDVAWNHLEQGVCSNGPIYILDEGCKWWFAIPCIHLLVHPAIFRTAEPSLFRFRRFGLTYICAYWSYLFLPCPDAFRHAYNVEWTLPKQSRPESAYWFTNLMDVDTWSGWLTYSTSSVRIILGSNGYFFCYALLLIPKWLPAFPRSEFC